MILFVFYLAIQIFRMLFYFYKWVFLLAIKLFKEIFKLCAFAICCLYKKIKKEMEKNEEAKLLKITVQSDIFEI